MTKLNPIKIQSNLERLIDISGNPEKTMRAKRLSFSHQHESKKRSEPDADRRYDKFLRDLKRTKKVKY